MINAIHIALHGQLRGHDFHADCPFCGKPAKRSQTHFSYSEHGYYCFVCGAQGGLRKLANHLSLEVGESRARAPKREKKPLPVYSQRLLETYTRDPNYDAWRAYRGLKRETVDRFKLGFGKLPGEVHAHKPPALILPVFDRDGRCRTLRARGKKGWLTAGGKTLYAPVGLPVGATIIVVENCANCCLIAQAAPHLTPIAPTTGATSWDARWPKWIAARKPKLVIIAGDNDDAGVGMNERWKLALEIAGVPVQTETWTEAKETELATQ